MEGAVYTTRQVEGTGDTFVIKYQSVRNSIQGRPETELLGNEAYSNALNELSEKNSVVTLDSGFVVNGWKAYWILKAVRSPSLTVQNTQTINGFVAIMINTSKLIGENIGNTNLSVMLLSDSAGLGGRQFLFQNNNAVRQDWTIASLVEEGITQFPLYSIKLSVLKQVPWDEIDKSLIYISILIGTGVTLLLIAVVKTRDEQERQLRDRNIVIEAKVHEQTVELAHARDEALKASLMKSSFLASMSHEIRTPLNAIIGMSDLLAETSLDFEQKKYVSVFKRAGDTLLSLVNDILDLSKIEANQLQLETIEFNLVDILEESTEIYALKAAEKGVELICDIEPYLKPIRLGDPSRLRQILLNLISNALKFTEKGEIVVTIKESLHDLSGLNNTGMVEISVRDTGTGIPADKLELIFASFTQADSSTTRKYGGTGLGLTISRRLVEMMGGKIWEESELNVGSCFVLRVDIPVMTKHPDNILKQQGSLTGKRIMLVDVNESSQNVLNKYIKYLGAEIIPFRNADSALESLGNSTSTSCDLVLTNTDLPDMDGFTLMHRIKATNATLPVILMLNPSSLNRLQNSGNASEKLQMYLTRPVKKKELTHQLINALSHDEIKKSLVSPEPDQSQIKPLRILLVDDSSDNRLLVKTYLKKLPYTVDEAENGEEAVKQFERELYDIVLMDVQMPVMDGREATRKIRQLEKQSSRENGVQIIALTAHAIKEEIDLCLEAGCNTHLSKPVKKSTLVTTIQAITG